MPADPTHGIVSHCAHGKSGTSRTVGADSREVFNGRALEDDVIDTLLQLILADPGATDGVDSDDTEFLTEFPYLAPPQQPE